LDRISKSLIVVGSGPWAKKVLEILTESEVVDLLLNLGARELLKMSPLELKLYVKDSIIWLCTNTNLQLEILKKSAELTNKIILEKPIYSNIDDQEALRHIIKKNGERIYLSTPWLYSKIWDNIKHEVKKPSDSLSISIRRFGNIQRNYLYPPQDWLFHDIYLIYDLFNINFTNPINIINKVWSGNHTRLSLSFNVSKSVILMDGGFSFDRDARWDIFSKNNQKRFDFYNRDFNLSRSRFDEHTQADFDSDNPVSRMFTHIIQSDENNSSLEIIDLVDYLLNPL
jgi:hypothetical protein